MNYVRFQLSIYHLRRVCDRTPFTPLLRIQPFKKKILPNIFEISSFFFPRWNIILEFHFAYLRCKQNNHMLKLEIFSMIRSKLSILLKRTI